jgi:stage V sporulation protein G
MEKTLEITDVQIFIVNEEKLKAYATITLENCFVVRDLKIIQGLSGLFVAMPAKKRKDGTFRDIAHPLNADMRAMVEQKVIGIYNEAIEKGVSAGQAYPSNQAHTQNQE